jgi:valyl-tRNA synthetase
MQELPKAYDPKIVDSKWYKFWEDGNFFRANVTSNKPAYSIVMPPPNVTGALHMGHALVSTLQDILIRWKRMQGFETLWVPGTDHAGIATQTVVERHLMRTTGKTRKEFSREEFLKHVWEWKQLNENKIISQIKKVGCSCDWSRLRFTMDDDCSKAVRTMFKKMFDEGLIYRGNYLVNWDPVTQTALADDEVEYEDQPNASLWFFKYPFKDGSGFVTIATTRPETMLGDTAVAVNPSDERFKDQIGNTIILPLVNREIPLISDHHVDPAFGTGMVKITPAHDPNDWQIGLRHNLPMITIMTPDGKINENAPAFTGKTMAEARIAVVEEMKKQGFFVKEEKHQNRVGKSYRSKAIIEPYLSKQWFVRLSHFSPELRKIVESQKVKLVPENWNNTYYHWIDNLRDWCISRQLWWGHRIPIWYNKENPEKMICWDGEGLPPEVKAAPDQWSQDEDVLDTWFSSALWPFSTLGWPEKTPDLNKFYPNSILVTGHDILFFWVARMILMGNYAFKQPPFPETFLHGLIYGKSYWRENKTGGITYVTEEERLQYDLGQATPSDVHFKWEKMSKSKGNVIDPLEIIDAYGTDAMRMALTASATQAREIDLDRRKFEEFKNFTNKVWNGARFVFMNLEGDDPLTPEQLAQGIDESALALEDHWILSAVNHVIIEVNQKLENYTFDQAATEAYDFFWKEFCAYYVEISKPILFGKAGTPTERKNKQKILTIVLNLSMRLLHPMVPFITEELFQVLKDRYGTAKAAANADPYTQDLLSSLAAPSIMVSSYPTAIRMSDINPKIEETFALVEQVVYTLRNIRGEINLPPNIAMDVHLIGKKTDPQFTTVAENTKMIAALVKTGTISSHTDEQHIPHSAVGTVNGIKLVVPIPEELLEKEVKRLEKEKEKLAIAISKMAAQLNNEGFIARAPEELVAQHRQKLEQTEKELEVVESKLGLFQ